MSKSYGNVIDPNDLLKIYTSDTIRYFFLREGVLGEDLNFNESSLKDRYNNELANSFGNLVQRTLSLTKLYCDGKVPEESGEPIFSYDIVDKLNNHIVNFEIHLYVKCIFDVITTVNIYLTTSAPWHLKGDKYSVKRKIIVRTLLESIYFITHFTYAIIPNASDEIFKRLNTPKTGLTNIYNYSWHLLKPTTMISVGDPLFPHLPGYIENNIKKNKKNPKKKSNK